VLCYPEGAMIELALFISHGGQVSSFRVVRSDMGEEFVSRRPSPRGELRVTPRQRQILDLAVRGTTDKEIAVKPWRGCQHCQDASRAVLSRKRTAKQD
jgi:hypothetical protein